MRHHKNLRNESRETTHANQAQSLRKLSKTSKSSFSFIKQREKDHKRNDNLIKRNCVGKFSFQSSHLRNITCSKSLFALKKKRYRSSVLHSCQDPSGCIGQKREQQSTLKISKRSTQNEYKHAGKNGKQTSPFQNSLKAYQDKTRDLLKEVEQQDIKCSSSPTVINLCSLKDALSNLMVIKEERLRELGLNIEQSELRAMLQILRLIKMIEYRAVLSLIFPNIQGITFTS